MTAFTAETLLAGHHEGWSEGALIQVLKGCHYELHGFEGSWRSWKHPGDSRVLTLWMPPGRIVYRKYVQRVAKHLKELRERGEDCG